MIFINMCLFSIPQPQEDFDVKNFTNTSLVIKYEFSESLEDYKLLPENYQKLTINNIDVIIPRFLTKYNELIFAPGKSKTIIYYHNDFRLDLIKLYEMSPCEKIKAIFKSFTIQTMDGMFIISNIGLGFNNISSNLTDFNWGQTLTITTNGVTEQKIDKSKDNTTTNFYYTNDKLPNSTNRDGYSVEFGDKPSQKEDVNISWQAELSLVGKNAEGNYEIMHTPNYGFTMTNGQVTTLPLTDNSNPSESHRGILE
jgi:hypothetical protein